MSAKIMLGLAAAASLIAGAAMAEDTAVNPSTSASSQPSASSTSVPAQAATPASGNVVSSTTKTLDDGSTLTTEVISNGPVPDTKANRARYGQPLSHAGRMTAPRGN